MTLPPSSVIVCSRNRPRYLLETVESVLHGAERPAEIVVVDQSDEPHPTLGAMGSREGCTIRYVHSAERGVSRARNSGMRAAATELLIYTDDDVFVHRDWLAPMVRNLVELGPHGVVTGRVLAAPDEVPGAFAPALVASEAPAEYAGRIARDVLEAGNMAVHRGTMLALGGFDEQLGPGTRFPAGEDNDMGYRLLAAGCRIRYVPDGIIYHRAWRGPEEYLPLRWRYGIGQGAYYGKHLRGGGGRGYMAGRLARLLRHHLWLSIRRAPREPKAATGHLVYVGGVLNGLVRRLAGGAGSSAGPQAARQLPT
jgi:GT2 family glycosyltransferase